MQQKKHTGAAAVSHKSNIAQNAITGFPDFALDSQNVRDLNPES